MTWSLRDERDFFHGEISVTREGRIEVSELSSGLSKTDSVELACEVLKKSDEWLVVPRAEWTEVRRLMEEMEGEQ